MQALLWTVLLLPAYSFPNCLSGDTYCEECNPGYYFYEKVCFKNCPTLCSEESSKCVCEAGDRKIFDLKFFQSPSNVSLRTFTPPAQENHPLYMGKRGFYFEGKSSLESTKNYIVHPENSINFWSRILTNGQVFLISSNTEKLFEVIHQNGLLSFKLKYTDMRSGSLESKELSYTSDYSKWMKVNFNVERNLSLYTSKLNLFLDDNLVDSFFVENFWLVHSFEKGTFKWEIGSTTNSFEGFLYRIMFYNSAKVIHYTYELSDCELGTFENSYSECTECGLCGPNCFLEDSCLICNQVYSCSECSYFNPNHCIKCDYLCKECSEFPWECSTCEANKTLVDGVCMNQCPSGLSCPNASSTFVIDQSFQGFPSYEFFNSGSDNTTYHPFNDPQTDDVLPLKARGVYFDSEKFLESVNKLYLNFEFTITMWTRPVSEGTILAHGNYLYLRPSGMTLQLENFFGETETFSVEITEVLSSWQHLAFTCQLEDHKVYIQAYRNNVGENIALIEHYIFRELSEASLVIGTSASGFIYNVKLTQFVVEDFSNEYNNEFCGQGNQGSCFWECDLEEFQDSEGLCQQCNNCPHGCVRGTDCNICSEALCSYCNDYQECSACVANAYKDQFCVCEDGYHNFESKGLECRPCESNCQRCNPPGPDCVKCLAEFAVESMTAGCECLSGLVGKDCICQKGFYAECEPECGNPSNVTCIECKEPCKECSGPGVCTSCEEPLVLVDSTCVECPEETFFREGECLSCVEPCKTCYNETACSSCIENMLLTEDYNCSCEKGFYLNQTECLRGKFYAELTVDSNNNLKLHFNETLKNDLTSQDYSVSLKNLTIDFESSLEKLSSQEYRVNLEFEEEVSSGEILFFEFYNLSSIQSTQGHLLGTEDLRVELNAFDPRTQSSAYEDGRSVSMWTIISGTVTVFFNPSPSSLWAIINTVMILAFIPLTNNKLTPKLRSFYSGLNDINFVPNLFEMIFNESESPNPLDRAKEYGFESNLFLVISGEVFTVLVALLLLVPVIWVLSKINSCKVKFSSYLKNYKYNFFLRFWIEAYLEVAIGAINQVYSVESNWSSVFNYVLGVFFGVLCLITPLGLFYFTYKNSTRIGDSDDSDFHLTWGSLYYELRTSKSFWSMYFYSVFFLKRLLFTVSIFLLDRYPILQTSVNIGLMVGFLIYLTAIWPFNSSIVQATNTITEIGICIIFSVLPYYLQDNTEFSQNIEDLVYYGSIVVICIPAIGSGIISLKSIFKWLRKRRSVRVENNNERPSIDSEIYKGPLPSPEFSFKRDY